MKKDKIYYIGFPDLKLLPVEDVDKMKLDVKLGKRQLMHINLSTIQMDHRLFPRLSQIVPQDEDYGIFEYSGNLVHFKGKLDPRKVNVVRDRIRNPRENIKKIVIQNISSLPIQKEVIEGTGRIYVSSPRSFQPINRLITNGILYLYYDRKFRLIKEGKDSIRIVPSGK